MVRLRIQVNGATEVARTLADEGARQLREDIDETIERSVRTMANEAAVNAPVDTGYLSTSIPASVNRVNDMDWEFGSDVEYAAVQEYTHKTKKAFFRKALWSNRGQLNADIREVIERRDS